MDNQMRFQTSFRFAIFITIVVTIFGLFAFTPTMAENSNIKLSDIQVLEGDIVEYQISADSSYVVYLADQDTDEVIELYSVPTDGSTPPIKLNSTLPIGGWVGSYKISADSNQVVYRANQDVTYQWELYSVPINGSTPPIKLNGPLVNEHVGRYQISADSSQVVYETYENFIGLTMAFYSVPLDGSASPIQLTLSPPYETREFQINAAGSHVVYLDDQDTINVVELYSVPIDGSALPTKINAPLSEGGDVKVFQISPDSNQVVYGASHEIGFGYFTEIQEIYSVPIDGSASPAQLNGVLLDGYIRESSLQISADSNWVIYLAEVDNSNNMELYSVPINGSASPITLNDPFPSEGNVGIFQISADSKYVVYPASEKIYEPLELYSVPIDGATSATKLNNLLISFWSGITFQISANSNHVVYLASQETDWAGPRELYSVPIDGSAVSKKLNGQLAQYSEVKSFQISADSNRVGYTADQDITNVVELYTVPIDGNTPPSKLNSVLASGGNVESFLISNDNNWVVYKADQDTDEMFELFAFEEPLSETYLQYLPIIVTDD